LGFTLLPSHAVKIRRSRPRLRGLILTALVAQAATMTTQQKQLITSQLTPTCRRQVYRDIL